MIDLHTHTEQSDGTMPATALVSLASELGLEALAITDHDTFAGYDIGITVADDFKIELLCGIEISARYNGRSVHLLAYFPNGEPGDEFRKWVLNLQHTRRLRNQELIENLRSKGVDITLGDITQRRNSLPGRPQFAALMVEKGYATSTIQAFQEYLGESGCCYTPRSEPSFYETAEQILTAGGIPVLAHPNRITRDSTLLEQYVCDMKEMGLCGIEACHSEHCRSEVALYKSLAERFSLAITGGSDFHGGTKPHIALGSGLNQNICIAKSVLTDLQRFA